MKHILNVFLWHWLFFVYWDLFCLHQYYCISWLFMKQFVWNMYSVHTCCLWNENHIYFWSESCKKGNKEWGGGVECQIKVKKIIKLTKTKIYFYIMKKWCALIELYECSSFSFISSWRFLNLLTVQS